MIMIVILFGERVCIRKTLIFSTKINIKTYTKEKLKPQLVAVHCPGPIFKNHASQIGSI